RHRRDRSWSLAGLALPLNPASGPFLQMRPGGGGGFGGPGALELHVTPGGTNRLIQQHARQDHDRREQQHGGELGPVAHARAPLVVMAAGTYDDHLPGWGWPGLPSVPTSRGGSLSRPQSNRGPRRGDTNSAEASATIATSTIRAEIRTLNRML